MKSVRYFCIFSVYCVIQLKAFLCNGIMPLRRKLYYSLIHGLLNVQSDQMHLKFGNE